MRLTTKSIIAIVITWIVFLAVTAPQAIRYSLFLFTVTTVIFLLITIGISYLFVFKQFDKLQKTNIKIRQEIVEQKQEIHTDKLTELAHYENGLPNRMFFNNLLNKAINHANRHKKNLAILAISLDSDSLSGDSNKLILKEMGQRFAKALRAEDVLAKSDGDEFLVLLYDIDKPKFASVVAEKILAACSEPLTIHSKKIQIIASIGICIYPSDGDSLETLLKNVNLALEAAKKTGESHYQFYTKEMDAEAHAYIQLANELRNAVKKNDFVLYYQPRLLLKSGNISGVETLLRWVHSHHGLINPDKFLAVAEETGLIIQMGEWVLREACKINKSWQNEGYEHITIGVNLSPKQFYHPEITKMITKALQESGLDPSYLEIEISEATVMNDIEKTTEILNEIKKTGVKISIDHFGTGYISIRHLKNMPISAVKIDPSFIKGVPHIPNDIAITNAFISLSHSLSLEVIAEGVETIEQAQYLAAQNCDTVQGYFLSHPLPAQKITLQFKKLMEKIL